MNKRVKKKWLKELRSGEWAQGYGRLMDDDDRACCLGVLCDIAMREGVLAPWSKHRYAKGNVWLADGVSWYLPVKVLDWAGLAGINPLVRDSLGNSVSLGAMNDTLRATFCEIADAIEAHL